MYEIERLTRHHQLEGFDCGDDALNRFLIKYALQSQQGDASAVYLAITEKQVVGYCVLAASSVQHKDAPERVVKGLAHHPVLAMLLARLAVSVSWQGAGIGSGLLKDAMLRTVRVSEIAGVRALLTHAKNDNARAFYEHFGFIPSPTDPYHMLLLVKDIRAALRS
jgi:GNAT superfamily N-acetyltransferase